MTTKTRSTRLAALQALVAGVQKHLAGSAPLLIDTVTYPVADIVTKLTSQSAAEAAVEPARAAWLSAAKTADDPRVQAFLANLTQAIRIMYASSPAILADFGILPRKVPVVSPDVRALAAAKARATRKARGTLGPVQKLSVKGSVTQVTLGPSGASADASTAPPAAAAPPASPAPASPSNGASGPTAPR